VYGARSASSGDSSRALEAGKADLLLIGTEAQCA
jgi:hypothetical protein